MIGTILNCIAIIFGCVLGLILKDRFPNRISNILIQGIGLISLTLGIQMAIKANDVLMIILSLVMGGYYWRDCRYRKEIG